MSNPGSKDDCYFYFYSSCTKGDDCPFRHCRAALGTETVCSLWREGRCVRDNCKFRHMESRINRATIQCYWEDQPSGCLKPHCVFMHYKPRPNIRTKAATDGLILPVSTTVPTTSPPAAEVKDTAKSTQSNPVESYLSTIEASELGPASIPIEPVVFSLHNEDSDSESASSTPMKSLYDTKGSPVSAKRNLSDSLSEKNDNLGIKTLEQIKMEKIHKESDNFYKSDDTEEAVILDNAVGIKKNSTFLSDIFSFSAYDTPLIEPSQIRMKTDVFKPEIYPPKSDFISISDRSIDNPVCANTDSNQHSPENERGFKGRILKRKSLSVYSEKSVPSKKVVCLKKAKEDDPLDFKIKTLDEIRKEKQNKSGSEETSVVPKSSPNISVNDSMKESPTTLNNCESSCINGKIVRKLKIKRQSKESLSNASIFQEADSSNENRKTERAQMILHEVQNISEDQAKSDVKGKRKEMDSNGTEERSSKHIKTSSSSQLTSTIAPVQSDEKQGKSSRPIIKRKKSTTALTPSPQLPVTPTAAEVSSIAVNREPVIKENCDSQKEENSNMSDNDKRTSKTSVDEIDNFLLNETDVSLDYEPDGNTNESDDILLEIEQLLDS